MTNTTKLPKDENQSIRDLKKQTLDIEAALALYDAALDGLEGKIDRNIDDLESYDLDERMARVGDDAAQLIADGLREDADDLEAFDAELDADDTEEEAMIADDGMDPEEEGRKLAESGASEE